MQCSGHRSVSFAPGGVCATCNHGFTQRSMLGICLQDNASLEFTADYGNLTNPAQSDVIPLGPARKPMQFDLTKNSSATKPLLAGSSALRRPILSPVRAVEDSVVSCRGKPPLHIVALRCSQAATGCGASHKRGLYHVQNNALSYVDDVGLQ